jgi:hypothetical protein
VLALKRADFYVGGPYFFFGLAFFGAFAFTAVFGRGALGFLVGTLAAFFALDGDFLGFAGDPRYFFSDFFTAAFFGDFAFTLVTRCFSFGPAEPLPRPRVGAAAAAGFSVLAATSLKDPDAPLPFVCTNSPKLLLS